MIICPLVKHVISVGKQAEEIKDEMPQDFYIVTIKDESISIYI